MIQKFVDILKEVFWLKPKKSSTPKKKTVTKKAAKKKTARKTVKKTAVKSTPVKKLVVKKPAKVKEKKPVKSDIPEGMVEVAVITHYFDRIKVAVAGMTKGTILIGDKVTIVGMNKKFTQKVWSMQMDNQDIKIAKKGDEIGFKVDKPVAIGDVVYSRPK